MTDPSAAPEVVVVGSMNRDYICRVTRLPRPGETVMGGDVVVSAGGKGGNQAVAAAQMGVRTVMVGAVGDDDDGSALLDGLHAAGADISRVSIRPTTRTGTAFVFLADDGENSIVVAPGANGEVTPAAVERELADVAGPHTVVVAQAEVPLDSVRAAIASAERAGARMVVNLAPYADLGDGALATADPLVVNETEAGELLSAAIEGADDARAAAEALAAIARSVVVTMGAAGAVLAVRDADGSVATTHLATSAVEVVDTTGAGDCFTGVLAAALSRGADLPTAVGLGLRAGTHAVTSLGAQASFPSADDLASAEATAYFAS